MERQSTDHDQAPESPPGYLVIASTVYESNKYSECKTPQQSIHDRNSHRHPEPAYSEGRLDEEHRKCRCQQEDVAKLKLGSLIGGSIVTLHLSGSPSSSLHLVVSLNSPRLRPPLCFTDWF